MAKKILYLGNGKWCWTETCQRHAAVIQDRNAYIKALASRNSTLIEKAENKLKTTPEGALTLRVLKIDALEAKLGRKITLGLDLDNTTGNFNEGLRTYMGTSMKIDKSEWMKHFPNPDEYAMWEGTTPWFTDRDDFLKRFRKAEEAGVYRQLPVFANASETLQELRNLGFNIKVITARNADFNSDTLHWIKTNQIPSNDLLNYGKDKHKAEGIDLYIDDAPEVISKLIENQKRVVIMDQLYNRTVGDHENARRTQGWDTQLVDAIFELLDERKKS